MDNNNIIKSPSSYQLRRLKMSEAQRNVDKERNRLRQREWRARLSEEKLKVLREQNCERNRAKRQSLSEDERKKLLERRRLLYQGHQRQNINEEELNSHRLMAQQQACPQNVHNLCQTASNVPVDETNATMTVGLQRHLHSEVQRFGIGSASAAVSTYMNSVSIHFNQGSSSSLPSEQLREMNIFDVNFSSNWNSFQVSTDIVQGEEENISSNTTTHNQRPSTSRRNRNECSYLNSARNVVNLGTVPALHLSETKTCPFCLAKLFAYESQHICCCHGRVKLSMPPIPPELIRLYTSPSTYGLHFRQNIRAYNHVHAFTSMGVHLDQQLANARDGIYTYRAQGSIYHNIGGLLPLPDQRPRYLQMYIYDTDHEIENRICENSLVDRHVMAILKQVLDDCNPYVHIFRQISLRHDRDDIRLHLKESTSSRRQYDLPTASQVAAILIGGEDPFDKNDRDIIVENRTGRLFNIPDTAGFYDPLQYPLLHPYGSFGWDVNLHDTMHISTREFYSYMLQIRETETSILLRAGRLLQQYAVDQYVKISTQNLRWIRDHQKTIRAELYQGLQDSMHSGESSSGNVGRKVILPASYIGSPRDMQRRYYDAMTIVSKYGKPDLFLTMTCNPNWKEIQDNLYPGQTPQDRPDLVTRIFRSRCEELKKDLFKKHVLGRVIAHVHVIEFQKRGLPHAHFLIILDSRDKPNSADDYDHIVRADLPDPILEPRLHKLVLKHMIHGPCGRFINPTSPCMKGDSCKKKFPKEFRAKTAIGKDSYPLYRRPPDGPVVLLNSRNLIDSRWVVPYNPWLLLKYSCHLNVEICSSIQSVKYLYKYVYKGVDRVSMEVCGGSSIRRDEVQQFVDARWICPHEALWRIFAFPLNRMYPAVYSLPVHLEHMHEVTFREQESITDLVNNEKHSSTMLTEFFETNKAGEASWQYLYHEFPEHYTWNDKEKKWNPRKKPYKVIGRLNNVMPSEGERFYLRVLLLNRRGALSFDDLKTVNHSRCTTFREAALHMGLLQKDDLIVQTMREASLSRMPSALRRLFITLLIYCNPPEVRKLWDQFHGYMIEDYPSSSSTDPSIRRLLNDLELSLNDFGKSIKDFDLPKLAEFPNEGRHINPIILDERSIPVSEEDLNAIQKLNNNQRRAFDMVMTAVRQKEGAFFFIDGPAGTGKTFLYRALLAALRNEGHIALATASSGIASIMMSGGRTAHSRFQIPIPTLPTSTCKISKQSDLGALLYETTVIIWDEASMAHRYTFEALNRTLQDLFGNELPFGGKIVILGGDFRQILPIVKHGSRLQTVNACVTYSSLWDHVQVLCLIENMRAKADPEYADMLLAVGNGDHGFVDDNMIRIPDEMIIPWQGESSIAQLIDFVFPRIADYAMDKHYIMERALITPKNIHVGQLNDQVLQLFPGKELTFHSFDHALDNDKQLYQEEFLNSISASQLPPHKLTVKIGCPLIVLRNLDPKNGVCNGTRVLLRAVHENVMHAEIMTGTFAGQPVLLPRIPLKSNQQDTMLPVVLIRNQFPVRVSFALTINKSQGQTIPNVGIFLPDHVFSHGQLYVALSRSTTKNNTKILIKNGSVDGFPGTYTRNVVYNEVLRRQG